MVEQIWLSMGDVARRLGYPIWKVQRMIALYLPGITQKVGHHKILTENHLPAIKKVLEERCFVREKRNEEKP